MTAVFVNMAAVIIGSAIGIIFRNKINKSYVSAIITALGLVTASIGICSMIKTENMLCIILCMAFGTVIGEIIHIDRALDNAGDFVKNRLFGGKIKENSFTEGFVSACILFCVGSMTIMGSFEAGINGDYSIIFAKSALDFISALAFGAAMGIGVMFSAAFILVFQGGLTLLAGTLAPVLSPEVVTEMSAVGGVILIGMAINMLGISGKRIKVANMLPSIFLPIAFVPVYSWISGIV